MYSEYPGIGRSIAPPIGGVLFGYPYLRWVELPIWHCSSQDTKSKGMPAEGSHAIPFSGGTALGMIRVRRGKMDS